MRRSAPSLPSLSPGRGWSRSLPATFTVQMLSFQWHFKQPLSIYSHSRFLWALIKMPLSTLGSFQPSLLGGASGLSVPEAQTQRLGVFGGRRQIAAEEEATLSGIVLVRVLLWHNLIIRLSLKRSGYHNCLLNNSINLSECNLWLDCKPGETLLNSQIGAKVFWVKSCCFFLILSYVFLP